MQGTAPVTYEERAGFLNPAGQFAIPTIFDRTGNFSGGLAPASTEGLWGFVDKTGAYRIEELSMGWRESISGRLRLVTREGRWGLCNRAGEEEPVPPQFEFVKGHAHGEFFDGMALAFRDGKYGFVSQTGSIAVEPMFDLAGDFGEGLALVEINGAYGYMDEAGKLTAIMPKFEDAGVFSDGLAQVCANGRWGYINPEGQIAIPPTFQAAAPFREGLALTILEGKWQYINRAGELVWREP